MCKLEYLLVETLLGVKHAEKKEMQLMEKRSGTKEKAGIYLVAINSQGLYFGLREETHTTTPFWATSPLDAKKIHC